MNLLIDVKIENKKIIIAGGGSLAERKVKNLLPFNPEIYVISKTFTPFLQGLQSQDQVHLIEGDLLHNQGLLDQFKDAILVYAATDNKQLNTLVAESARENKILVCAIDKPDICDFFTPATLKKGSIRVGICTDGKSPLMSKMLKDRFSNLLTNQDALQVELQHHVREIAKLEIRDIKERRDLLYEIYQSEEINQLLKKGQLDAAKRRVEKIMRLDHENE